MRSRGILGISGYFLVRTGGKLYFASGTGGSFTTGDGSEEISAFAVTPVPLLESFELALNNENIEPGTPLVLISGHKDSYASQAKQQKK